LYLKKQIDILLRIQLNIVSKRNIKEHKFWGNSFLK
jgi:hypothetical protein